MTVLAVALEWRVFLTVVYAAVAAHNVSRARKWNWPHTIAYVALYIETLLTLVEAF